MNEQNNVRTQPFDKNARIFVAGHLGMVGSAVIRQLRASGYRQLLTQTRQQLELTDSTAVSQYFEQYRPQAVVIAAAKVGGILANSTHPVEFLQENLLLQTSLLNAAHATDVKRLVFLGSSCIYPRLAEQPITEAALLSGHLEPTNDAYAIAKIAGIKLCEAYNRQYQTDFRCLMPTNLYGPQDNFNLDQAHVAPALMRRLHEAKINGTESVSVWGTGNARREFLHVDDLARAVEFILSLSSAELTTETTTTRSHLNVGTGQDISIAELARLLANIVGYQGQLEFDQSKPDGTPRKLLNVDRLKRLGWQANVPLAEGLHNTYRWYCDNQRQLRQ